MINIGNAPCSWGTLEFEGMEDQGVPFERMLDELAETGYTGTELGDWGYMPTDAVTLKWELNRRKLTMLGAFVPIAFRFSQALAEGAERALRTAELLKKVARADSPPFLVLADDNGSDPIRTAHAGRVTEAMKLDLAAWRTFAEGVDAVAQVVFDRTGLRTVFHHHGAGFVETPDEIQTLLDHTDPKRVGLVFDTGHYMLGGGEVIDGMERFRDRIWYVHFKDFDPAVLDRGVKEDWDYFRLVAGGVFCELGQGGVPFDRVLDVLNTWGYEGWICVEQDVLPGMGAPKESARRNRIYLEGLGL